MLRNIISNQTVTKVKILKGKIFFGLLIILIIATMAYPVSSAPPPKSGVFNSAASVQDPNSQMYMDQLGYNFTSPPTKAGDKFLVNVYSYNISKLYVYQVVLVYNRSVLNCTNAWPNNGWDDPNWVFYDRELGMTAWQHEEGQPSAGYNAEMVGDMLDTFENISLVDTEVLMARFEFEILVDPPSYGELMTVLDLANPFFGGTAYAYAEIPIIQTSSDLTNSNYVNKWEALPTIEVEPESYTATHVGETFDINVTINDADASLRIIAVQFRLSYDNAPLEVVEVVEGPFMRQFNTTPAEPYTYFMNFTESDGEYGPHVLVGILLLPNATGNWTVFPEGTGTLATITFNATAAAAPVDLKLVDTILSNDVLEGISHLVQDSSFELIETLSHRIVWEDLEPFYVRTVSNGRVSYNHTISSGINLIQPQKVLTLNVTGIENITSFCNITIPRELLDSSPNNWIILVGGETADYIVTQNDTHSSLWFNITHSQSTLEVEVFGETVIPEFPIAIIPTLFIVLTLLGVALKKTVWSRKRECLVAKPQSNK